MAYNVLKRNTIRRNMMKSFRHDNTDGYTEEELDALNLEWEQIVDDSDLEGFTDEYYEREKAFTDEVSRR